MNMNIFSMDLIFNLLISNLMLENKTTTPNINLIPKTYPTWAIYKQLSKQVFEN
jgi:hypothetical protein